MVLLGTDLDRTIIFSEKFIEQHNKQDWKDNHICLEHYNGKPLSYVTKETFNYLYNFLKSMDTHEELKYSLGYINKVLGYIPPNEFNFNKEKQYIFESIIYSAMKIYQSGNASKTKLTKIHEEFENDIMKQKEEKLSRTLELNAAKIQALKELGYTEINEDNYKELMDKIAEIESRRV